MIRWISALDETPAWPAPCVWVVRLGAPQARFAATPGPEDLADAALARARDAGAGRLWRRRLLRALAARWLDAAPDEIVFRRETSGSVRLVAPRAGWVSAASRGDWAAVGVAVDLIGVDIELDAGPGRGQRGAPPTPPEADLERWTATEAYAKATGCSLDEAWAASAWTPGMTPPGRPALSVSHLRTDEIVAAAAWR